MAHPLCLLRGLWRTIESTVKCGFVDFTPVSGHNFIEQEGTPSNVKVFQCEVCGECSIGWSHGSVV